MRGLGLRGRRVVFVGGKGGVGKTTTAAALAVRLAEEGRRVLLVSTDPAHSLGDVFDADVGDRETPLLPNLRGMEIDPEAQLEQYLEGVKSTMLSFVRPAMYAEVERQIELARHSPGAVEAAMMDRMAELMERAPEAYDHLIFDTAPTGHTLRLLALPEIMAAWTDGLLRSRDRSESLGRAVERLGARQRRRSPGGDAGDDHGGAGGEAGGRSAPVGDELSWIDQVEDAPDDERGRRIREVLLERRRRFARTRRVLLDRDATAFVLVLVPEKLPILESRKTLEVLRRHGVPVAGVVVNRVLPPGPLGEFLESRRLQEADYLARIDREFGDLPRVQVPLLPRDVEGVGSIRKVAAHLRLE